MTERDGSRFEGMALAKLAALEERVEEVLRFLREIEGRCMAERATQAAMSAELRALREKTGFNSRVIWAAVVWVVLAAAGMALAAMGLKH